ncbi:MAG: zinc ribbon domain-containing protein [Chloroflexota bacterium]
MNCPNCNFGNDEGYKFCQKCGSKLTPVQTEKTNADMFSGFSTDINEPDVETAGHPPAQKPPAYKKNKSAIKDLLKNNISPAEGELTVMSYHCTYYKSRLLGLEASGYLGVTNKRVIFQALGTSNAGSSIIQSEVPIADVSGISSYKGTFFSFGHMLSALALSTVVASLVSVLLLAVGGGSQSGSSAMEVLGWIFGILACGGSFMLSRESIWRSVMVNISSACVVLAGGGSFLNNFNALSYLMGGSRSTGSSMLAFFIAFLVAIYGLVCVFWYARRPTFSLAINSKGGSSTPISISGASGIGIFDVSAGKALAAEPAVDSEPMLKELGAMIMDIQTLGDLGIDKWKSQ